MSSFPSSCVTAYLLKTAAVCTMPPSSPYFPSSYSSLSEFLSLCITKRAPLTVPIVARLCFNLHRTCPSGSTTSAHHPSLPLSFLTSGTPEGFLLPSGLYSLLSSADSSSTAGLLKLGVLGLLALYPFPCLISFIPVTSITKYK